jgi:serine/threonine-protein kinase HipA
VFNWLIGNTDGHLKNYSLLYSEDLKTVRLAPAYDVINTIGYKGMTHEMAFAIGNAKWIEDVTLESFRLAAKEAGLGERMAMNRLDEMVNRFRPAIISAAETLKHQCIKGTEELKDTILQSSAAVQ